MYLKKIWHAFAVCLMLLSQVALAEPLSSGWLKHPDHPPVKVQLTLADVDADQVGELNALLDVALSGDWKPTGARRGKAGSRLPWTGPPRRILPRSTGTGPCRSAMCCRA